MTKPLNTEAARETQGSAPLVERRRMPRDILRMPVSDAVAAARRWIRHQRDARFTPRRDAVDDVLQRIASTAEHGVVPQKVLIVVAHPDDEAIGAGAVMRAIPGVIVLHVTDGAPADPEYAIRKGFRSREAYARQRRLEVTSALGVIGIPAERIRGLGFVDGEVAWQLVDLCRTMVDLFDELKPDVVLTHPYEGGHSDHDSTAFAVHLAAGLLNCEGGSAPLLLELTSYHNYQGRRRLFDFLPFAGAQVRTVQLNAEQREIKQEMFAAFTSQAELLKTFPIAVERFRQAPRYLFTVPPHDGQLDYERLCRRMTGAEWRAQAERALETLRARKRFSGGVSLSEP